MNLRMRVLVTPRDIGPYQKLLFQNFEEAGVRVRYAEGPTPSQTLNVLFAPLLLVWWRLGGYRLLNIHWVYHFSLPWAWPAKWSRKLMEIWFNWYLRAAILLGYSIVWTAHDLLPHQQVFLDDARARNALLQKAKIVIALSEATATELRNLGARHVDVIPIGPYRSPYPIVHTKEEARASFGFDSNDFVVSLIGRMERYKGADLLLDAAMNLPKSTRIKLLLVGQCVDETYLIELSRLIENLEGRVTSEFSWIPDEDLARYLQATNVAVFPFRAISNSGSILLAQSFGLPVIIPNLTSLNDIPDSSAIRYEPGLLSLVAALVRAEQLTNDEYSEMSSAALKWSNTKDWTNIAGLTIKAYEFALRRQR